MKRFLSYRLAAAALAGAFASLPAAAGAQMMSGQSPKPMMHGMSNMSSKKLSATDRSFMKTAAEINHGEVAGGNMAQQRGTTTAVRNLGKTYVDDHTENQAMLASLASRLDVNLPASGKVTPDDEKASMKLKNLHGRAFDMTYLSDERKGHESAIDAYQHEVSSGSNSAVIAYAKKSLPTLEKHLDLATQDAKKMHA